MYVYSTYNHLHSAGRKDGKKRGVREGVCRQIVKLLRRHGKRAHGPLDEMRRTLLDALAEQGDLKQLERLQERFLGAASWDELLDGISAPADHEKFSEPDYVLPYQFNPAPIPPSVDEYVQVGMKAGGKMVLHLRFQRMYQKNLGAILYKESEHLRKRYQSEVQTLVMVLCEAASGPGMSGVYKIPGGKEFRYRVSNVWEKDAKELVGGAGTAVFAPLGKVDPDELPEIVRAMDRTFRGAAKEDEDWDNFWGLAYAAMGLRYSAEQVNELLADYMPMIYRCPETKLALSQGYHAGVAHGQSEGALQATRRWVLTIGAARFGEPPPPIRKGIETNRSLERLEQMAARTLKQATWNEALALS